MQTKASHPLAYGSRQDLSGEPVNNHRQMAFIDAAVRPVAFFHLFLGEEEFGEERIGIWAEQFFIHILFHAFGRQVFFSQTVKGIAHHFVTHVSIEGDIIVHVLEVVIRLQEANRVEHNKPVAGIDDVQFQCGHIRMVLEITPQFIRDLLRRDRRNMAIAVLDIQKFENITVQLADIFCIALRKDAPVKVQIITVNKDFAMPQGNGRRYIKRGNFGDFFRIQQFVGLFFSEAV